MSSYQISADFKQKLLCWANQDTHAVCLEDALTGEVLVGVGGVTSFKNLVSLPKGEWLFGYIAYDYKNKIEDLVSENPETISFDYIHFFIPKTVISLKQDICEVLKSTIPEKELLEEIQQTKEVTLQEKKVVTVIQNKYSREEYLQKALKLQEHIRKGDIYEVNFCQEFFAEDVTISPLHVYEKLLRKSPMPFGTFLKQENKYVLCASPERYILKLGSKMLSQPIKGTAPRGTNSDEDALLIYNLEHDEKERAENVMAVDVVRNDFARVAIPGTVSVDELCKVYTFKQLHQMISTVSAEVSETTSFHDIVQATFPMASMTGAPKIRAMQLIEEYENTRRGMYSGTIGYIAPNGDFDFNVVIRTLLVDAEQKKLSFIVGSAITAKADVEKEYEECLLKAQAIKDVLKG